MRMTILFVDNLVHSDPMVVNMVKWVEVNLPGSSIAKSDKAVFDPELLLNPVPDIAIVDAALTSEDEAYCDAVLGSGTIFNPTRSISGIEYCRRLKASFSDLPVILISKYFLPEVVALAIEAGVDGFLAKDLQDADRFIAAIKATFHRCRTDDSAFYAQLRDLLENESLDAWERRRMLPAMNAFFTRGSGSRRLTGLWCNLAGIVEPLLSQDAMNGLLCALMDTEAILLAANPRMRDHVRHAGNVFWLGYYLLNRIAALPIPRVCGFNSKTFDGSHLDPFQQLNLVWLLASLLHDVGYLRERIENVHARLKRGCELLGFSSGDWSPAKNTAPSGLEYLKAYMSGLGPEGQLLFTAISEMSSKWGTVLPSGKKMEDHGLDSGAALLGCIQRASNGLPQRPEILHAVAAIALHNLAKWNKDWPGNAGFVKLPIGILPGAWPLGFCDELQGWGREPEPDPFAVDSAGQVAEARRIYREGHVKGSRISSFHVTDVATCSLRARLEIGIQYMMVHGDNIDVAAGKIRQGIEGWNRDRAKTLRETLGLDGLLETTIIHRIPDLVANPIEVLLDGCADV